MAGRIEVIAAVASTLDLCRAPEHFVHVSRRLALETREESRAALVASDNFFTTKPEAESRHSAISEPNFPDVPPNDVLAKRCISISIAALITIVKIIGLWVHHS
jgi:hypothetical protein